METSNLPEEFFRPLMTALGQAWPRPRTRYCLMAIENVQKRMAEHKMVMNGIPYGKYDKAIKMQRWNEAVKKAGELDRELQGLMDTLSKFPITKEQFKRPNDTLSQCCDSYVNQETERCENVVRNVGSPKCVECGSNCLTYTRVEREDWEKEYKECMKDEQKQRDMELAIHLKKSKSEQLPRQKMPGNYLI